MGNANKVLLASFQFEECGTTAAEGILNYQRYCAHRSIGHRPMLYNLAVTRTVDPCSTLFKLGPTFGAMQLFHLVRNTFVQIVRLVWYDTASIKICKIFYTINSYDSCCGNLKSVAGHFLRVHSPQGACRSEELWSASPDINQKNTPWQNWCDHRTFSAMYLVGFVSVVASFRRPTICCTDVDYKSNRTRIRARVAYEGTQYCGWQLQPNNSTIQGEIEKVLERRVGRLVRVVGASRTDSGVHALGQAVHFDLPMGLVPDDLENFQFVLNQMLPHDIRISRVQIAPVQRTDRERAWHAIFSATGKRYSYKFSTRAVYDPLQHAFRHYEYRAARSGFYKERLTAAARLFEGSHDFTSFTNNAPPPPGCEKAVLRDPVRTIHSLRVREEGDGHFRLDFEINGALYKMIRNIAGTLLDTACGRIPIEDIPLLFEARDRRLVPKSAPARGLCLEHVHYDNWT